MEGEKLCLKWNDFPENLQTSFGELRGASDFTDVTLACEDKSIKAHKVILSACSPFFKRLLKTFSNPQPLIYMRGVKASDLVALVDFIYQGEANIEQEQLERFLALAEEFEVKGLAGCREEGEAGYQTKPNHQTSSFKQSESFEQKQRMANLKGGKNISVKSEGIEFEEKVVQSQMKQKAETANIDHVTMTKISSMIARRPDGFYTCTDCEYTTKSKSHMQEHVEKHIEGLEYPCNSCSKVLRSSLSFRNHKRTCHT